MADATEKKTALVTGGSRGIGRAICLDLARDGFYIIINYKSNREAAEETLSMITDERGEGEICCFDVGNAEACAEAVKDITARMGGVDVLVNNAGITADGLFAMMPERDWNAVINTTLNGFFNVTKPVLKKMIRKRKGSIVSISSVAGLTGNKGQTNYAAAKAGLIGASKSLAMELARIGIRVNVVAPGLIETDMIHDLPLEVMKQIIPMQRIGRPEEVAKAVRFLCSDDASYITGQVLAVNGGMI
ncbi:MAG TPA: 3-oxoacyl-ACP reductase FabG [Spirochaetota bacterium]|nr:3-oxoacyl-ACP reductase FabG [Spirochaetota bacterium]HPI87700.1 3-oxoacyl-ACP reductase FabG [Spirochaetota bacterium]HPR48175.1 3-oxoacyl-ACP reductase FabG [Spirochaetota bacterium]